MQTLATPIQIESWPIGRLIPYARNPRKNDAAVERMCSSIREFGFKIPCLVRSDGQVIDGHLRLKAARQLGMTEIPVILCDEWTEAQVKAFRLLVNRSVTWADWDEELLALELQELKERKFDLELTGFDVPEIDKLLVLPINADTVNVAPKQPPRGPVIYGCLGSIGCCVATPPRPSRSNGCWWIATRFCWSPIHRTVLSWIRSGGIEPD